MTQTISIPVATRAKRSTPRAKAGHADSAKRSKQKPEPNPVDELLRISKQFAIPTLASPEQALGKASVSVRIGGAIRTLRVYRMLSQGDLAQALGVAQSKLSTIERGKTTPDVYFLYRVCQALKVSVSDLVRLSEV